MTIKQFKQSTKGQLEEYGKTLPMGTIYNNGHILSYKDSTGYWIEYTYVNGNLLSYKDSDGYSYEWTYDENSN